MRTGATSKSLRCLATELKHVKLLPGLRPHRHHLSERYSESSVAPNGAMAVDVSQMALVLASLSRWI